MMDYHSVHGHDVASFDISSSHRLPTVSASAALEELESSHDTCISSGLQDLDTVLSRNPAGESGDTSPRGGLKRGQVTEVWGPPGAGKTALGLQLSANAICTGQGVVWIDCFQSTSEQRITSVLQAVKKGQSQEDGTPKDEANPAHFTSFECLTLPHFIALVSRPTTRSIPGNVGLVVVSSVTSLINAALPRAQDGKQGPNSNRGPNPGVKRRQALQSIMKSLQTLASTRNCAVVVLSQCATRMHSERGATLTPAVNANLWEQGVSTRLVLFRDWSWAGSKSSTILLAGIQKLDGKAMQGTIEHVVSFQVGSGGISYVPHHEYQRSAEGPNVTQPKRKLGQTDFEIPDSEDDEDYGWANEDEAYLPPQPQQWQGSEDILLGQEVGQSEDEDDDDDQPRTTEDPAMQDSASPGGSQEG